ncbi:hypothetical protein Agub_g988, partial [Astrephomene gubernaculifera]
QGATAAALLLAHLAGSGPAGAAAAGGEAAVSPASQALRRLKCAILVAGFLPRDPAVAQLLLAGDQASATASAAGGGPAGQGGEGGARLSPVPLLFVTGSSDALVPPDRTAQLYGCFPPARVSTFTHGGAHLVPTCSGDFKTALTAFLDAAAAGGPVPAMHRVASREASLAALQQQQSGQPGPQQGQEAEDVKAAGAQGGGQEPVEEGAGSGMVWEVRVVDSGGAAALTEAAVEREEAVSAPAAVLQDATRVTA